MSVIRSRDAIVGRCDELAKLLELLRASVENKMPAIVHITGRAGIGKSALLRAFLADASVGGWLAISVACHATHRRRPFAVISASIRLLLRSLGETAGRYTSGLEGPLATIEGWPGSQSADAARATPELTPAQLEAVALRIFNGVLHDYPVLLAFDDASCADAESIEILDYVAASVDRAAFVVAETHRVDDDIGFAASVTHGGVVLSPLRDDHSAEIVRRHVPNAPDDVIRAIVNYASGIPLDVVTLAVHASMHKVETAGGVLTTIRSVVESDLARMTTRLRHIFYACAVLPEPVPLRLLRTVIGADESEISALIVSRGERYLACVGSTVSYRDPRVMEMVRDTVPNPYVLRGRALATELLRPEPTDEDCNRIVELAAACGDEEVHYTYLVRLADSAYRSQQFASAVDFFRDANSVRTPPHEAYVAFYLSFSNALRANDADEEAARVLACALRDAKEAGITHGLGVLAGALIMTLDQLDDTDGAIRTYEHYIVALQDLEDRSEILASAACLFAETPQTGRLEETMKAFADLPRTTSYASAKRDYARAITESRHGNREAATRALQSAAFHAGQDRSLLSYNVSFAQLFIDFHEFGNVALKEQLPQIERQVSARAGTHAFASYLAATSDLLNGDLERAIARIDDLRMTRYHPSIRARLLSIPAAIQAFSGKPSSSAGLIGIELDGLMRGMLERSAVLLGSWWLAFEANASFDTARSRAVTLREWSAKTTAPFGSITFMPVAFTMFAERCGDRSMLRACADAQEGNTASPWLAAQRLLARGIAATNLGDPGGAMMLRESAERFDRLGAPFLAGFATARLPSRNDTPPARQRNDGGPSAREREIGELVRRGYSNRAIAQHLFLSERTVEAHLSNLFGKLGLHSRTQLARWFNENDATRA